MFKVMAITPHFDNISLFFIAMPLPVQESPDSDTTRVVINEHKSAKLTLRASVLSLISSGNITLYSFFILRKWTLIGTNQSDDPFL